MRITVSIMDPVKGPTGESFGPHLHPEDKQENATSLQNDRKSHGSLTFVQDLVKSMSEILVYCLGGILTILLIAVKG